MKRGLNTKQRKEDKFTPAQVITALELTAGIVSAAARKLGCDPDTVRNYIKRYLVVAEAKTRIEDDKLDLAESVLIKLMQSEDLSRQQLDAAKFYLMWRGQSRGYGKQRGTAGKTADESNKVHDDLIDLSHLTDEQLVEYTATAQRLLDLNSLPPNERAELKRLIEMEAPPHKH